MRNTVRAARRVASMSDEQIQTFAKHDPDIFRDVALALIDAQLRERPEALITEAKPHE